MAESSPLEGYTAIPNQLIDTLGGENGSTYSIVLFIARHTIGRQIKVGDAFYRVKEVCLSYDEFAKGRRKRDGSRMPDTSGLKYDDAIERGIQKAKEHGFIEIVSTAGQRGVRVYTIADTFWLAAGFTTAIKMLADPRLAESATAWKILAVGEQNPSSAPENPSSSARKTLADKSPEAAQKEAGRDFKHSVEHRRENKDNTKIRELEETLEEDHRKEYGESMDDAATQDVDALAQSLADQQVLQSLLAERQALQTLQPGQSGWGAAQRRLRAIAPEIARLQAACATQAAEPNSDEEEAFSLEVETTRWEQFGRSAYPAQNKPGSASERGGCRPRCPTPAPARASAGTGPAQAHAQHAVARPATHSAPGGSDQTLDCEPGGVGVIWLSTLEQREVASPTNVADACASAAVLVSPIHSAAPNDQEVASASRLSPGGRPP